MKIKKTLGIKIKKMHLMNNKKREKKKFIFSCQIWSLKSLFLLAMELNSIHQNQAILRSEYFSNNMRTLHSKLIEINYKLNILTSNI